MPSRSPTSRIAKTNPKVSTAQYEATITAARKAGGNQVQSHWEARLKAEVKRRGKAVKRPTAR